MKAAAFVITWAEVRPAGLFASRVHWDRGRELQANQLCATDRRRERAERSK